MRSGVWVVSQHVRLLVGGGPTFGSAALNELAADLPNTSEAANRNIEHESLQSFMQT
jgi:hypothetical protein